MPTYTELHLAGLMRIRLASEECGRASGGSSGEQISRQVLQLLGQRLGWRSSSRTSLFPGTDLYTVLGMIWGFDSRYFSLAWTESLGKPYLHVGGLGAAATD